MTANLTLLDHISKLAGGSHIPTDSDYVESYFKVFDDLKRVVQGSGLIAYIRSEMAKLPSNNIADVEKLDKNSVYKYLQTKYDLTIQQKESFTHYIDLTSQVLYTAVMGEERVIFTDIEKNLRKYHQEVLLEIEEKKNIKWTKLPEKLSTGDPVADQILKKEILDDLIKLLDSYKTSFPVINKGVQDYFVTIKEVNFFYSILGKVMEGSLSQSRKSKGGSMAEKIIEVLLKNQSLDSVSCQVKDPLSITKTGTKTDIVVEHNGNKYCIAVQLSTNDRMRLGSDEFHQVSTANFLVSLNGCQVSTKGATDISVQRMGSWMHTEVDSGEIIPFFVGIKPFINHVKDIYLNNLNTLLTTNKLPKVTVSMLLQDMPSIRAYILALPNQDLKDKFVLALWAHRKAISFEDFITYLKA